MLKTQHSISGTWAETNPPGLAIQQPLVIVTLKANALLVWVRQYPMMPEAKLGITKYINWLLEHRILVPC